MSRSAIRWATAHPTLVLAIVLLSPALGEAQGLGDLMVSPKRVVFEGRERSDLVTLVHRGSATATYRISFVNIHMNPDGTFVEIDEPAEGQRFAESMIHYSPRQVVLEPGVSQQVRLFVRRPADLEPGEYRSHLRFVAVPPAEEAGTSVETLGGEERSISIRLTPIYGVTIPIIVRQGELAAEVTMTDMAMSGDEAAPEVALRLERRGDRSVYGDLTFTFAPDSGGSSTVVGVVNGIAVYAPNPFRDLRWPLRIPDGLTLARGTLEVTYAGRGEPGDEVLARNRIRIP